MRNLAVLIMAILAGATLASAGPSQDGPTPELPHTIRDWLSVGNEPGMFRQTQLVQNPNVRRELKLSQDQINRWGRAEAEYEKEALPLLTKIEDYHELRRRIGRKPETPELAALRERATLAQTSYLETREDRLLKELTPPQRDRLTQLQWQSQGHLGFRRPELLQRLSLDDEQSRKLPEILDAGSVEMEKIRLADRIARKGKPLEPNHALDQSRAREIRAREGLIMKDVLNLLRPDQRASYQALLGEPFDFARPLGQEAAADRPAS